MTIDWTEVLLRQEGKGRVPTVNPLTVPRFINHSESFIGIYSDADTTGGTETPLGFTLHEGNTEVKKAGKKEKKKEKERKKENEWTKCTEYKLKHEIPNISSNILRNCIEISSGCHFKYPVFSFQAKVNKSYLSVALYPFTNMCVKVYDIKFLKFYCVKAHEVGHLPISLLAVHKRHHATPMPITISLCLRQLLSST